MMSKVHSFPYRGCRQAMDTLEQKQRLEELWVRGRAYWEIR
jgi:hypothetical protein